MSEPAGLTEDRFFGGRISLLQPRRGHRVGSDAALLAAAGWSRLGDGATVADLGAGVGAVGLALATLGASRVHLVEIDPELSALSARNAEANGLSSKVEAVAADVASLARRGGPAEPARAACDLVVTNPPFDDSGRFRESPDAAKARAHLADGALHEVWIASAERLLKPRGALVMIHRPEALGRLLAALSRAFGDVRVRAVHPRGDEPASRVLVGAVKARRGATQLLAPLILHGADGGFTEEADAVQRGVRPLFLG